MKQSKQIQELGKFMLKFVLIGMFLGIGGDILNDLKKKEKIKKMMMKKRKPCYSLQIGIGILMIIYWIEQPVDIIWMNILVSVSIIVLFGVATFMNYYLEKENE